MNIQIFGTKKCIEEEPLSDPLLLKTPVVRNGRQVSVRTKPEVWKTWA